MDLWTLYERIGCEGDGDRVAEDVVVLTSDGETHEILSLNWSEGRGCWVLIAEMNE